MAVTRARVANTEITPLRASVLVGKWCKGTRLCLPEEGQAGILFARTSPTPRHYLFGQLVLKDFLSFEKKLSLFWL